MKCELIIMTPKIAQKIIDSDKYFVNKHSETDIETFTKEMKAGNWLLNGETIKFNSKGFLLDGYKRLMACIKSGCDFPTLIAHGVNDLSFSTPNSGKSRSLFDALYIQGVQDAHIYAPVIKRLYKYKFSSIFTTKRIKNEIYYEYYLKMPKTKLNKAVKFAEVMRKHSKAIGLTQLAFMYYILAYKNEKMASEFFRGILLDENTKCMKTLRSIKQKLTYSSHNEIYKLDFIPLVKLIFYGWNLYYSDQDVAGLDIPNKLETPFGT